MPVILPITFSSKTQRGFVYSPEKYTAFYGGRGNGKTTALCIKGNQLSETYPENVGLIGRLSYPELRDTTRKEYLDIVRQRNGGSLEYGPVIESWNKTEGILTYRNGSIVYFRHLDNPETKLSYNLGWFGLDQAEEIPEDTYLVLEGTLRYWGPEKVKQWQEKWGKALEDRYGVRPVPKHYGFIVGNPAPGWVKKRYQENAKGLYTLYEAPSEDNRANLPKGFIEQMRESYPEDWVKRFVDGSWDVLGGQVYKEFNEQIHVIEPFKIPEHWRRLIGLDHGYTNPTAVLWAAVDEEGNIYIYQEHYKSDLYPEEHAKIIHRMSVGQPVPRWVNEDDSTSIIVWIDPSTEGHTGASERSILELYRIHRIHGRPANNRKAAGILRVQEFLHPNPNKRHPITRQMGSPRIFIFRGQCPNLVSEFKTYEYDRLPPGKERNAPEEPKKYRDHALDVVRYLVMTFFDASPKPEPVKKTLDPYHETVLKWLTTDEPDAEY